MPTMTGGGPSESNRMYSFSHLRPEMLRQVEVLENFDMSEEDRFWCRLYARHQTSHGHFTHEGRCRPVVLVSFARQK